MKNRLQPSASIYELIYANQSVIKLLTNNIQRFLACLLCSFLLSPAALCQWTQLPNAFSGTVYDMLVDGDNLYIGSSTGVHRSLNNGDSWTQINNGLPAGSRDIFCFAKQGNYLFAGTVSNGLYRSSDGGASWQQLNNGININRRVIALMVVGSNIFASVQADGLYKSINHGNTWSKVNTSFTNNIQCFAVKGDTLFAGTGGNTATIGVYKATLDGESWELTGLKADIRSLYVDGTALYAGSIGTENLWVATNNSSSWNSIKIAKSNDAVGSIIRYESKLYVGTGTNSLGSGVFVSADNGQSWLVTNRVFSVSNKFSIKDNTLFSGTNQGVYKWAPQPPIITSVVLNGEGSALVLQGAASSPTVISATNFSNDYEDGNIIYFGAVKTPNQSQNTSSLLVGAPLGTTYEPISVTNLVTNLTAYYEKPFIIKFAGSDLTTTAFSPKVDLSTAAKPYTIAIGDLDGDGWIDLVTADDEASALSVFRNTTTSLGATIGVNSFSARIPLNTGAQPQGVAFGDIDGDGKKDLVVANYGSNSISVFRNTSIPGTISFATKTDFPTNTRPFLLDVGDLDKDGRPDLAITVQTGVDILRNTTTQGNISFANPQLLDTGNGPNSVSIRDLDGDGRSDLALAGSFSTNVIHIFRNTTTSATLSFENKIDIPTGHTVANSQRLSVGDIDGDGKPDLILGTSSDTVSVYRNNITAGINTGSFAQKTDLTTGGSSIYGIALSDLNGDGKVDIIASCRSTDKISVFQNNTTSGNITSALFSPKIDLDTGDEPYIVASGDLNGDSKPEILVNNYTAGTLSVIPNNLPLDTTPPTATLWPANNDTDIAPDDTLTLTFDEPVQKGTGSIIVKQGEIQLLPNINLSDVTLSAGDTKAAFKHDNNFKEGSEISIEIPAGAFKDRVGNNYAGTTVAPGWNFTVLTTAAPTVTTQAASNINAASATLNGLIKANHLPTTLTFKYSNDPTSLTKEITASPSPVTGNVETNVTAVISGLELNTTYYYQIVGKNTKGEIKGEILEFTTLGTIDTEPTTDSLFPADDAPGVSIFTDLVLTFSEAIQKGTGSITIKQGDTVHEIIEVSSTLVTLSGNDSKVTINPSIDFPFEAAITVEIPAGAFKDKAGNDFAGTSTTTWNFTTLPPITFEDAPITINDDDTNLSSTIVVNYPAEAIKAVIVHSKSITRPDWKKDTLTAQTGTKYLAALPATIKDEIGLEYYFEVVHFSGQRVTSEKALVNITYNDGLAIPLVFGSQVKDYQILSIPLDLTNKSVTAVLNKLDTYNERKWRLYSYDTGKDELIEFKQPGFTTLEPGKGYLLIVKDEKAVKTGTGSTLRHNSDAPYTLTLKKGWNLIGNPYNLNLSWEDIELYNGKDTSELNLPGISNLKIWTGVKGYEESDRLDKFSGGIVYCDCTDGDVILKLPVERNTTYNGGRLAAEETKPRHYAGSVFETNFTLYTKELSYGLAGLGMHPKASAGKDDLDKTGLPRMPHYLQVNFAHPEYFYGRFTKDMAPVEENRIWEFTAETNLTAQEATLAWENYFATSSNKQLLLYDIAAEKVIDMKTQSSYKFELSKERKFRVYYGDAVFVEENLKLSRISLFANSPNPFSESTTISFAFPPSQNRYQVQVEVFDINGKRVATLVEGQYPSGFHQLNWDGRGSSGQPLSTGMYVGRVKVVSDKDSQLFSLKMIRK